MWRRCYPAAAAGPIASRSGRETGSNYRVGLALNKYLSANAGYELELVVTTSPGNVDSLLSATDRIDLATINSADDEAVRAEGLYGLAALELQHFFVVVPNDSPAQEFRDLAGPVNPGVRDAGDPPTLGERVLDYYGMVAPKPDGSAPQVTSGATAEAATSRTWSPDTTSRRPGRSFSVQI